MLTDTLADTLGRLRPGGRLPEIDAERCVHSVCADATCRACVDACPRGAWVFDDDALGLDTTACDGCGICVPACPTHSIWFADPRRPARRLERGALVAFAACAASGVKDGDGLIPCLHALGLGDLLALAKAGVRRLVAARGACETCPDGGGSAPRLAQTLETVNRLLESRGAPPMTLVHRDAAMWHRHLTRDTDPETGPTVGRRNFFRLAATKIVAEASQVTRQPECPTVPSPGTLLPPAPEATSEDRQALYPAPLYPYVPAIDAGRCTGCHACVRICPHQALTFQPEPLAYRIDAANCTACGLCRDVCEADAVSIAALAPQTQSGVPLASARCHACGQPFNLPEGRLPENGLCRICGKTNHYGRLFQVLP